MPAERMVERYPFDYTVVRIVPRVERQEFVNAGVILYCKDKRFLEAQLDLELTRVSVLFPQMDLQPIRAQLMLIPEICAGEMLIDSVQEWSQSERFRWLAAPKSTVVQTSPPHRGLCYDPAQQLAELFELFVA